MTKTANYQLNQWEPTDKLSRADFNSDNAAIDAALKAKAEKSAVTAVENALASKANNSAVTAVETALANYKTSNDAAVASAAAKADAAYSASNPGFEFVTVDTTGLVNGDTVYSFETAPKFVIIQGTYGNAMVKSGDTAVLVDKIVPTISSGTTFSLAGKVLKMTARNDSALALSLTILVHY